MNRDYQKFAKADLERGLAHLARGEDLLPEAFQAFWGVYENCLNCLSIVPGQKAHERNRAFEKHLREGGFYQRVLDALFTHPAAQLLADLEPRIFREEIFQASGTKDTSRHNAFSSDMSRYRRHEACKEPIKRTLDLLYEVRCNQDHRQKPLPEDWPAIRLRNLAIFEKVVPLQRAFADLLFQSVLADGLFVYGTLCRGGSRWDIICDLVVDCSSDWNAKGTLYDLGEYPGFVGHGETQVVGDLVTARDLWSLLTRADEIEGAMFTRSLCWLIRSTEANDVRLAWVYCYNQATSGVPRIRSGKWRAV
jgi:gamma-glutamylcyclotransferase (GGCT)/AIG2-like uncharacterized protein YtfP